jgi:lysophospholipase L1-like esterase
LNYALNPNVAYCGFPQFNADYKIRRSEPIHTRNSVSWRALIIGGSTTFCEGIPREEETWPFKLERLVREKNCPDIEIINCGVGGYTILENLIHYCVLLKDLKPDLVILYTGINDVHARLFGNIVPDYSNYRKPWRNAGQGFQTANHILAKSWVYVYSFLNFKLLKSMDEGIGGQVSQKGPKPAEWSEALDRNSPEIYSNHLSNFVSLLKAQNVNVVILPQKFDIRNTNDALFNPGVLEHNRVNYEVASTFKIKCDPDLFTADSFKREDLLDNCHFSASGATKMANIVYEFLKTSNVLPSVSMPK